MKGYIKFKATEDQIKSLSDFISIREDFLTNSKNHVHTVNTWGLFKDTCSFDTAPSGLFWMECIYSPNKYRLYMKNWYKELRKLYKMLSTGEEVMLDQEAYEVIMRVLSK